MLCIISIYNYKILSMIMKRIILLTVVSFAAIIARAQSFHYYPLKEVGDTIEYLKLNFDKQADYFVGRTFDEFWQIIRRDIIPKLLNIKDTSPFVDPHGVRYVCGAYVACMDLSGVSPDTVRTPAAHIRMYFKPPFKVNADRLFYKLPENMTVDGRAKYLADFVIDDIWVFVVDRRRSR